jgi:hypothetical protein
MVKAERRAEAVWEGDLIHGHGQIVSVGSGAVGGTATYMGLAR